VKVLPYAREVSSIANQWATGNKETKNMRTWEAAKRNVNMTKRTDGDTYSLNRVRNTPVPKDPTRVQN
jgi:hypothetical protein